MPVFDGVQQLHEAVGTHLGYSEWHTISQDDVDRFAAATGDYQWIHTDPEKAAAGPYGTTIAHGYLTLSLLSVLCAEVYSVAGVSMVVNYGVNKVRFPAAVPSGSRVRAGVELVSVEPGAAATQVLTTVTIELEGSEKPACVAESVSRVVP